ncbi:MAG TPA: ResB protein required for cytochrome C biosynthesis, partial [Opitutaceae bacterium]
MSAIGQVRSVLVSLRLTVVLLALSIVLVFWATLDQVHLGVWGVQQKFFHSFVVSVRLGDLQVPVFPGGYLIGGLLLVNLVCAHLFRLKATWRKSGIWLTHAGLILLLVGELVSGLVQRDNQMRLDEGQTKNYSESTRSNELAIIDATDPKFDEVVSIPEEMLARGTVVQNPKLPFRVVPKTYYPNSEVQMRSQAPGAPP